MVTRVSTSSGRNPIRAPMSADQVMPTSVWSPGKPLPMSWSRVPDQQQVGPADPVGQGGGIGGGLEEVPVDGEAVVRIALGLVPDRRPLGEVALEQLALVEGLEGGDGRRPGGQDPDQSGPQVVAATGGGRRRLSAQQVEGRPGDGQVLLGGHGGEPEGQRRRRRPRRPPRPAPPRPRSRPMSGSPGTGATGGSAVPLGPGGRARRRRPAEPRAATMRRGAARRRPPPRPRSARPWPRPA